MTKVWDPTIQCYVDDGTCHCVCHREPGVMHVMACCDNPPAKRWTPKEHEDFWKDMDPGDETESK